MEPFRFFRPVNIPQNNQGVIASFTVPQNRTLHIEFIAGDITLPAGESSFIAVTVQTHNSAGATNGFFTVTSRMLGNIGVSDLFEFGQALSIYADAGTTVGIQVNRFGTGPLGAGGGNVSASGQLFT